MYQCIEIKIFDCRENLISTIGHVSAELKFGHRESYESTTHSGSIQLKSRSQPFKSRFAIILLAMAHEENVTENVQISETIGKDVKT